MKRILSAVIAIVLMLCLASSLALVIGAEESGEANNDIVTQSIEINGITLESGKYLSNGATDVSDTQPTTGGYAYFYIDKTDIEAEIPLLELNNFNCDGAIYSDISLIVVLKGENKITLASDAEDACVINVKSDLTFKGNGKLNVQSNKKGIVAEKIFFADFESNIEINVEAGAIEFSELKMSACVGINEAEKYVVGEKTIFDRVGEEVAEPTKKLVIGTAHNWGEWSANGEKHTKACKTESTHILSEEHQDDNDDGDCDVCLKSMFINDPSAPTPDLPEPSISSTEKKTEESKATKETDATASVGCGSTVAISAMAIVGVLGTAIVIKKK